jgi:hypothetical protein
MVRPWQNGCGLLRPGVRGCLEPSVGVTVLLELQDRPKYLSGARDLVLGHNFLTFALQFTGADVSFPSN